MVQNFSGLQLLVRLSSELGLKEAGEYVLELKRAEKAKEIRERIGSSRPGSRRSSGSGRYCFNHLKKSIFNIILLKQLTTIYLNVTIIQHPK